MSTITGRGGRIRATREIPEPGDVLTSGQVATLMKVSPRHACALMDRGHLKGYKLPGSQDRRFHQADVVEFMLANDMFRKVAVCQVADGGILYVARIHERWGKLVARVASATTRPGGGVDWLPGVESRYELKAADAEAFQVLMDAGFRFLDGR
jgi:excisionase family DNA binding protein